VEWQQYAKLVSIDTVDDRRFEIKPPLRFFDLLLPMIV